MNHVLFGTLISCCLCLSREGSELKEKKKNQGKHERRPEKSLRSTQLISRKFICTASGQIAALSSKGTVRLMECGLSFPPPVHLPGISVLGGVL